MRHIGRAFSATLTASALVACSDSGSSPAGGSSGAPISGTNSSTATTQSTAATTLLGDVAFSMPSQTFQGNLEVGLTSGLVGEIHYTTDGTLPTASSATYSAPLTLTRTTQIRAAVFVDGVQTGLYSTAVYIARAIDATSDIPLIVIDGYGAGEPPTEDRSFRDTAFMAFEPAGGSAALSNLPNLASRAGWHVRGQSSASFAKRPYRLELWDNLDQDADYPLLGLAEEADWALVGPFSDRSLIRNAFIYGLGRDMGMQAPHIAFAEVYFNYDAQPVDADDYFGVYAVTETIKNANNRLDLFQLDEMDTTLPEISGGYIFKFEFAAVEAGAPTLQCTGSDPLPGGGGGFGRPGGTMSTGGNCWTDLEVHDPVPMAPEQNAWLSQYVQAFHDALHAEPIGDYAQYINVGSFVDQFIINELSRDMDAYIRSAYFFKDRDGVINAGPLWDYNLTLDVGGYFNNRLPDGWQYTERGGTTDWFVVLGEDPAFMAQVATRWQELRRSLLSDAQLLARLDTLAAPLANAAARDFARWPVREAAASLFELPAAETWEGQLQAIRDWLPPRLAWLDTQLM